MNLMQKETNSFSDRTVFQITYCMYQNYRNSKYKNLVYFARRTQNMRCVARVLRDCLCTLPVAVTCNATIDVVVQ